MKFKTDKCIYCNSELHTGGLKGLVWCNMDCKKKFFLKYYSDERVKVWIAENDKKAKADRKKVLATIKKSGMTIPEYIHFAMQSSENTGNVNK